MNAKRKKGHGIFQIFSTQGQSDFLVVSTTRRARRLEERQRRKEECDQHTVMRARQEKACQELSKIIKYMSERQEKLLAVMERKKSSSSEAPEDFRKQIFQEIREPDEKKKNSGEEMGLWRKTEFGRNEEGKEECQSGGSKDKVTAKGDATWIVVSELLKQRPNSFRLTWRSEEFQTTQLLLGVRKAMEVSTRNGAEGKFPTVDTDIRGNQEGKRNGGNNSLSKFWDGR